MWSYQGRDAGILLFDACFTAGAPMPFDPGAKVLEIGCDESDWLERAWTAWPDVAFSGIDTRPDKGQRPYRFARNAIDPSLFPPATFDAIVSLSAMEHMGLGHYGDPVDPDGDITVARNAWTWLKPGGWCYFDVPYDPTGYRIQGTKCRIYDDETLRARLVPAGARVAWMGFANASHPHLLLPRPASPVKPFHYVACVLQKSSPDRE